MKAKLAPTPQAGVDVAAVGEPHQAGETLERAAVTPQASLEPPMQLFGFPQRLTAEALGTGLLTAMVIGSGIFADRLSGGNAGVALLASTLAISTGLVSLIVVFGPISGAHFNPVVTLLFALRREISPAAAVAYAAAQTAGAVLGVWATHLMFAEPVWQVSTKLRDGAAQGFSEFVATFGLVAVILGTLRFRPNLTPVAVGLYIMSACWFTASSCFIDPAISIARSLSDTFAGIAPSSLPQFIAAQFAGGLAAIGVFNWLLAEPKSA
jgi:glycerol uptake facilitator-like aquaporin